MPPTINAIGMRKPHIRAVYNSEGTTMTKSVGAVVGLSATVIAFAFLTAGCAGRAPAPVPVVQIQDSGMDCLAIQSEVRANDDKIRDLGRESGNKVAQNGAAGVAGLFIPVLWFAMDFQGATDKDTAALQARQNYLGTLAAQRGCGGSGPAFVTGIGGAARS
jgi:hypothetical protein